MKFVWGGPGSFLRWSGIIWEGLGWSGPVSVCVGAVWGGLSSFATCFNVVWGGLASACYGAVWSAMGWYRVVCSSGVVWRGLGWFLLVFVGVVCGGLGMVWGGLGLSGTSLASACFGWSRMSGVVCCGKGWSGLVSACFGMVWWVWGGKRKVNEPGK